ncbi:hypothetical protein J6590_049175 [Homalodisca vitripennis]|nr:hypothetical protein J6590_049175 [Homalodisca vitripennis]
MRPTSLQLQQFNKPPKTTYQVLLGKFTTPVQTTKDGIPLSCYCRAIKEQVLSSLLLLITPSTERILLKDADSVKMLPQAVGYGPIGTTSSLLGLTPRIPAPVPLFVLEPSVNHSSSAGGRGFFPSDQSSLEGKIILKGLSKVFARSPLLRYEHHSGHSPG